MDIIDSLTSLLSPAPAPLPVEPRWSNTYGDVLLVGQLSTFTLYWLLHRRPLRSGPLTAAYYLYGLNLFSATIFTASGALIHALDPLPQTSNLLWKTFLISLAATPVLFPAVLTCALTTSPTLPPLKLLFVCVWLLATGSTHLFLALTSFDFAPYLPPLLLEPIPLPGFGLTPDIMVDGRSFGGSAHGIEFDLLSSIPAYRGDSVFPHCMREFPPPPPPPTKKQPPTANPPLSPPSVPRGRDHLHLHLPLLPPL